MDHGLWMADDRWLICKGSPFANERTTTQRAAVARFVFVMVSCVFTVVFLRCVSEPFAGRLGTDCIWPFWECQQC
jgi:hypothetical protein